MNYRLLKELEDINQKTNNNENYVAGPKDENSLYIWKAILKGPIESPYEGGIFNLELNFNENYPFSPPKIVFLTRIYHPNISIETGFVCMEILETSWKPIYNVNKVLSEIVGLLKNPTCVKYLEPIVAYSIRNNMGLFLKKAKDWTVKYAK